MPDDVNGSPAAIGVSIGLSILALLVWAFALALLADLAGSDPAGNAYAQAYAAIAVILVWLLLAIVAFIAWIKGAMPWPGALAALILIPLSGVVAMTVLGLLSAPDIAPFRWPIVIPALVPPLVIAFCIWALVPALRAAVPAPAAAGGIWGAILVLCIAVVPFMQMRDSAIQQESDRRAQYAADLAKMPADAPLWDWTPFLATRNDTKSGEVLDRIQHLERRQADAELMLARGDLPLRYLGSFDLTPTPALCDKARALLRRSVAPLVLTSPDSKPYAAIATPVADALAAMRWLVGYDCSCDAESLAWENMAKAYQDTNFDVFELARLRDPKELGQILRERPARFSMLSPKAHLKAWLRYADEKGLRDQAIAGARQLDHRTSDAVEMLANKYDISAPWLVLKYLPVLDLETTPPLCKGALAQVHGDFSKVLRPRADDPRPYSELLDRLGAYDPMTALKWLAAHGCDAEAELSEAEGVVRTYQDSPDRAAALAALAQLHRKP
jgi:hypothetical protein